ncbi:UNVERIFIED_CONTAM: ABC transporter family protein [Hammondia hammondi]|eukprot:XP_008882294.1 ABC transporter family protein [Hammondia hammondi]
MTILDRLVRTINPNINWLVSSSRLSPLMSSCFVSFLSCPFFRASASFSVPPSSSTVPISTPSNFSRSSPASWRCVPPPHYAVRAPFAFATQAAHLSSSVFDCCSRLPCGEPGSPQTLQRAPAAVSATAFLRKACMSHRLRWSPVAWTSGYSGQRDNATAGHCERPLLRPPADTSSRAAANDKAPESICFWRDARASRVVRRIQSDVNFSSFSRSLRPCRHTLANASGHHSPLSRHSLQSLTESPGTLTLSPRNTSSHAMSVHPLYFSSALPFSTTSGSKSSTSSSPSRSSSTSSTSSTFLLSRSHSADCRACPVSRAPPNPTSLQLLFSLFPFLWPAALKDRLRVLGSVACLVTAKVLTIQAPLLLANLVDAFQVLPHNSPLSPGETSSSSPASPLTPSGVSPSSGDTSTLASSGASPSSGDTSPLASSGTSPSSGDTSPLASSGTSPSSGDTSTLASSGETSSSLSPSAAPAEGAREAGKPGISAGRERRDEGATVHLSPVAGGSASPATEEGTVGRAGTSVRDRDAGAVHALDTEHLRNTARIVSVPLGVVCGFPLARIAATGFNELRSTLFTRVSQNASCDFSCHAFLHLHALALFHDKRAGELSVLISRGMKSVTALLNVLLFQMVPTALEFALVLYLLGSKVGGPVACITSLTMAVYVAFTTAVTARRTKIRREMIAAEQQSVGLLVDSLANAEAVRFFTAEKGELSRFEAVQRRYAEKHVSVNQSLAFLNFGQQLIFNLGVLGSLAYTASQVAAGLLPVGHIVLVSSLLLQLAVPLNFVGTIYRETILNLADLEKLYELMNHHPPIVNPPNAKPFVLKGGAVAFENVTFSYPPSPLRPGGPPSKTGEDEKPEASRMLLDDVSFSVDAGEKVAIVGPSGVGKSTLIKLLFRMFDPASGAVRIDDQDVKELDLHSFRRQIGVVPQDMVLFNDTIEFNIKYGCPSATDEEMRAAAKQAEIDDVIMRMPQGYNTVVGERGLKLSGGERQRIGIARCLLRNPAIAIFDEATSALDSHTEQKILKAFRAMARGRTTLVIAHRLSTISDADKIIYLKEGKIAEMGSHAELLEKEHGLYRALWESQQHQAQAEAAPTPDLTLS